MKHRLFVLLLVGLLVLGAVAQGKETLVVYTYDSFVSWGPAARIETEFEAQYDCDLQFVAAGGAKATLSRLLAEREAGETPADLFMGELNDLPRITAYDLFLPVDPAGIPNLKAVPDEYSSLLAVGLVPYEYGYITLTYDSNRMDPNDLPPDLASLTAPQYADKLVCEDPRTSSTGFSFLLWTIAEFGEDGYLDFWRRLDPSILTVTQGWSAAWSLLTHGEAPLMVSYSTDTAYAALSGDELRYRAYAPGGEGYRTVYGIGIVNGTHHRELAEAFIDFLLSPKVQGLLPGTEVMFPINPDAPIPPEFAEYAIVPTHPLFLPLAEVGEKAEGWLDAWARVMTRR